MAESGWSEIIKGRRAAAGNLPNILRLKVVPSARDLLVRYLKKGESLLDIGGNDRNLKSFLDSKGIGIEYFSFDVDTNLPHDYYDLDKIDRVFDVAVAFEVIEHLDVKTAIGCFKKAHDLLKKDGLFVVSTPNVCNPVVFWRDCTHITPFRYDELYGVLASTGFKDIEVYRCGKYGIWERLKGFYYRPLLKLMRMDFAPGIVAVARKA